MSSRRLLFVLLGVVVVLFATSSAFASQSPNPNLQSTPSAPLLYPAFTSPYASNEPLENFLVFTAAPRSDVPDGQIHWTGPEVPGIDLHGPDDIFRNPCPETGLAWSLEGGDPFGGGQFVAVECQDSALGWQVLAFHLCKVRIGFSISASQRSYTTVAPGEALADECPHTHFSLGYWAKVSEKKELPCPQWYVQERYWVNAACLIPAVRAPELSSIYRLTRTTDWELQWLTPRNLRLGKLFSLALVIIGLGLYLLFAFFRPGSTNPEVRGAWADNAVIKTGAWVLLFVLLFMVSAGPVWPINGTNGNGGYTAADAPYQQMAEQVGYRDWRLLQAFYAVAVPRDATGHPTKADNGKVFPPQAAAAIPFGETNAESWGLTDPTLPGPYGAYRAWEAVADRWPVSAYERDVLGLSVSQTAQKQREGLLALAVGVDIQALAQQLGKPIGAQDLYGSSAGAVGRTQILPGYFAPGALCGDLVNKDVWNNPLVVAECTTRYLTISGCWGSWWETEDVWSAYCGYNPGAWNVAENQWYWNTLQDRMTRLTAASSVVELPSSSTLSVTMALQQPERNVSTLIVGLLFTEALLQDGHSAYQLPGTLNAWATALAPQLHQHYESTRTLYRFLRLWTLIYYSPEDLARLGIQF